MTKAISNIKITLLAAVSFTLLFLVITTGRADAACPAVDTSRGTVTSTINVPASGSYRVWSRMQASSATNDSYVLEIDDTVCGVVVGDTSVSSSNWQWVDYQSGNASNKITVNLSAGQHTVKLIGREDSVKVDKLLFLSDTNCTPTGFGENCEATADTTPPTVSVTSPANNSDISGTFSIQANASDDTGVTKVEFYINDTLLGTDTQSPYSFGLDTTQYTNGDYTISARAFDAEGNNSRSNYVSVSISNAIPDTTPPQLFITSPLNSATVSGAINVTSSATDENGISRVDVLVDNNKVTSLTSSPYTYSLNTSQYSDGNHTITVKAYDPSNNETTKSVTVQVDNSVPPPLSDKADFNNNGIVDLPDLAILLSKYGQTVSVGTNGDCNDDGQVTLQDLAILLSVYGT